MECKQFSAKKFALPQIVGWRYGLSHLMAYKWNYKQTQWQGFWWENYLLNLSGFDRHTFFDYDNGKVLGDAKSHRSGSSPVIYLNDVDKTLRYATRPVTFIILVHNSDTEVNGPNYKEHAKLTGRNLSGRVPKTFHINIYPLYVCEVTVYPWEWSKMPILGQGKNSNGNARKGKFGLDLRALGVAPL